MAAVWKVQHSAFEGEAPLALKVLHDQYARNEDIRERFLEEAKIQRSLNHQHILAVRELILTESHVGIVMELVDTDLSLHIQDTSGPIPWHLAKDLFLPLLDAVEHAHNNGIVHRDLKPSNVLLLRDGERLIPKLTDFGIAKQVGKSKTQTGSAMGTLAYMAPEQHRDAKNVDQRADIYALGVTLYEMLTGRIAYKAESDYDLVHAKLTTLPPVPSTIYAHIPEFVEGAVMMALASDPEHRPADCAALRAVLLGSAPVDLPAFTVGEPAQPAVENIAPVPSQVQAEPERMLVENKAANLYMNTGAVGGRLTVTSQWIRFKPHRFNFETEVTEIPMGTVLDVQLYSQFWLVPNGLRVFTTDGSVFDFVVGGRTQLRKLILGARKQPMSVSGTTADIEPAAETEEQPTNVMNIVVPALFLLFLAYKFYLMVSRG